MFTRCSKRVPNVNLHANFLAPVDGKNKGWRSWMNVDDLLDELVALGGLRRNGANFWGKWCKVIHQEGIRNLAGLSRFSYVFEAAYKSRQGQSRMPAAYKSAKSAMKKALRCGVPFMDRDGNPRPKTAVFNDCE